MPHINSDHECSMLTFATRGVPGKPFDFEPNATRVPRGWERVPKAPFNSRRKGRKVWKRHDSQQRQASDSKLDTEDEGAEAVSEQAVKRQCLKNMPAIPNNFLKQRQYMSTLFEQALGTPKRM